MYLIYYSHQKENGKLEKGWMKAETKEQLEQWSDENINKDDYFWAEIIDLERKDLVDKLHIANEKLRRIAEIL